MSEDQAEQCDEPMSALDALICESKWAHIVSTADGPAIEINGAVIGVRSADPELHVEAIVRALRRAGGRSAPWNMDVAYPLLMD